MKEIFVVYAIFAAYQCTAFDLTTVCPATLDKGTTYTLVPHPCNCTSFVVCFGKYAVPVSCTAGLYFNGTKKNCDFTYRVNCTTAPSCFS